MTGISRWLVLLALTVFTLTACGGEPTGYTPERQASATQAPVTDVQVTAADASEAPLSTANATMPSAKFAPAFELPNAKGETVSLASYAGNKNVVLVFYRGFW